jgi:hypothetical protein
MKYIIALAGLLGLLGVLATPAHASHGAPDVLVITSIYRYNNLAISGDALFVVRYAMLYEDPQPTEPINQTTIGKISDVGGDGVLSIVSLSSASPIPDLGYSHGLFSFYFEVAPVPTGTLTVEISPNPGDSTLTGIVTSSSISLRTSLTADMRNFATDFESIWLGTDIIDSSTGSAKLTVDGANYFNSVIPGLNSFAPDLFISGSVSVDPSDLVDAPDFTFRNGLRTQWVGTPIGNAFTLISASIGFPQQLLEQVFVVLLLFGIGGLIYIKTQQGEIALMVSAMGLVVFGVIGLGYLEFTYVVAAFGALAFAYKMFFSTSGA